MGIKELNSLKNMNMGKGDGFMIFYFTGTGNSLFAARTVAEAQGEQVISIAEEMDKKQDVYHYELGEDELLGFAFPVYAWAPPKIVLDFIKKLDITGVSYVFSLCTCGNEEGNTSNILRKKLKTKGIELNSAFTLCMPNNYVIGFDVDSIIYSAKAKQRRTDRGTV